MSHVIKNMTEVEQYLQTLTEKEKQAYQIAKDHLGSLFDITKSNGFLAWKKKKNEK